jgi:hypothetical protein
MSTAPEAEIQRKVQFLLDCEENDEPWLTKTELGTVDDSLIVIKGESPYACPVFELNSMWRAL